MSSPSLPALQRLHRLNRSLPEFHNQLNDILHGREYTEYVPDLQGDDLAWLVDYLDKVRPHHPPKLSVPTAIGSRRPRSFQCHFPEVST